MTEIRGETEMHWDKDVKTDKAETAVRIREGDKTDITNNKEERNKQKWIRSEGLRTVWGERCRQT